MARGKAKVPEVMNDELKIEILRGKDILFLFQIAPEKLMAIVNAVVTVAGGVLGSEKLPRAKKSLDNGTIPA